MWGQMKSILITGCSSGIGYDAAHALKARGWRVFATCRKPEDCARLEREGLESFLLDVADADARANGLAEALERSGGRLDALYNNAGFACPGAVEDLPIDALREIFETNLFGLHELTRLAIPVMRRQGGGRIVNCSSVLGLAGIKWRGAYVATKFALEGLTDVLRLELRGSGIHVILLEPGPVTSRIRENAIAHFERWIDWQRSARAPDYAVLRSRLYQGQNDRWELPAAAVSAKLIKALESPRPKPRYMVTLPTYATAAAKRLLPTRLSDLIFERS
jgi:NAD(P)-dependent dehydrogenase (short-subunit alcohol dehydrogenase family)